MNRTFHRHFSISAACGITVFAVLSFFFFISKAPVSGLLMALIVVLMTERMIHTTYVLTQENGENVLIIDKGRLGRRQLIRLSEVVKVTPMRRLGGLSRFVMIVYGADRMLAIEPEDEDGFCRELMKRMSEYDDENV